VIAKVVTVVESVDSRTTRGNGREDMFALSRLGVLLPRERVLIGFWTYQTNVLLSMMV
jgi:hypothetical protein